MERTSVSSWGRALRHLWDALIPRHGRRSPWSAAVPLVVVVAGVLFTTTATTARGTALRDDRTPQLSNLIADRNREIAAQQQQEAQLRRSVDGLTAAAGGSDEGVAAQQAKASARQAAAGLTAVRGPGLTVRLNDAPHGKVPQGVNVDQLVVHQQDVQAVVNALWAGGAEAMTIMGVRVISTSAVRCVGNTLLLDGRVYSPPFVITAIGDPARMRAALDIAPAVILFREAAAAYGLGYDVRTEQRVTLPAYDGSTALRYAQPAG